ncbi:FAD/NAD(P)-binding domain-containing protein [Wilcoxina mikolae CBS 423.85]|nr:FAD/NAD(P)-binding domain-containing protein [Wilcoxina mikolae CBS 423.85]
MASLVTSFPKTGIKLIIVGAGFGGLTAAIESCLKGHDVVVLEKAPKWEQLGDIISIGPNAGQILARWDRSLVADRLDALCMHHKHFRIHTHDGEWVLDQGKMPPNPERPMYNGHRADIHRVLYEYAMSLGIPIHLGKRITSYHEDDTEGKAWVTTDQGEVFKGDVVVGADGTRSRARKLVLGYDDKPKSSGYAIYRAWFDAEEAGIGEDILTREFVANGDTHTGWLGPDVHFLVATCKGGKELSWVCTHKDEADIEESWSLPGKVEDVLKILEGWDPRCRAIVEKTPSCVDWKLVYREPLPTWITPTARTCLLGDAAHPFLPTSIQGCSQAVEDGCVLATCLALSHADPAVTPHQKVPTALKTYQRLRYERVKSAQKIGDRVRDMWHKADWSKVRQNPDSIKLPREDWLMRHDCEGFVHRMWSRASVESAKLNREWLACGPESDEFSQHEMPATPPAEEIEKRLQ